MSIPISIVNAASDTFQIWLNRTNQVINAISTGVMTLSPSANGDTTSGNGYVNGVFGAFILVTPTLCGGNVQVSDVLTVTSNLALTNSSYLSVGNSTVNATMNSTVLSISNMNVATFSAVSATYSGGFNMGNTHIAPLNANTAGTSTQVVDTFLINTARSVEYTLTVRDNSSNAYQMSKLLLLQDGGNISVVEYGMIASNGTIGVFTSSINATAASLNFTPIAANTTMRGSKTVVVL
jgi:hypothetical protein